MSYRNFRGATANPEDASGGIVNEYSPDEVATVPGNGSNPLVSTSTGPLKVAFWAVVAIVLWKWMKK